MAETKIAKIRVRRGSTVAWSTNNPVLNFGEIGIEDTGSGPIGYRVKIGDDSTNWNSLPYRTGTPLMATGPLSLTSTSSTSVMTVPVGGLAVVSSVQLLHTSVSSYPASATVRLGPSTNLTQLVDDFSLTVSGANDVTTFDLGNFFYAAGTQLMFGVVSASGAATHVARLVLEGILIPA